MTETPGLFLRNFKLTAAVLVGFSLAMIVISARMLMSLDDGVAGKPDDTAPEHHRPGESAETSGDGAPLLPDVPERGESTGPARDHSDLDIMRQKQESATKLYEHLRQYSRENPDADDALSEQEIREMEKAGAIVM